LAKKDDAMETILAITRNSSYRGYPHKAWGGTLAATDKVSEFYRQK